MEGTTKLLIVHADDLGMAHTVNRATFEAMEQGICSSASVMVPAPWFPEVAEYAAKHRNRDIGIHLTLTSEWTSYRWRPIAPLTTVRSLVDPDGYLWSDSLSVTNTAKGEEVEVEVRAQINRALESGIEPTHLDSHMFVLFRRRDLLMILERVSHDYSLPFPDIVAESSTPVRRHARCKPNLRKLLMAKVSTNPTMWTEVYTHAIGQLEPGISQLIVHLGFDDSELRAITQGQTAWGSAWRQRDFQAITSPDFRNAVESSRVRLVGWKDVWNVRSSAAGQVRGLPPQTSG